MNSIQHIFNNLDILNAIFSPFGFAIIVAAIILLMGFVVHLFFKALDIQKLQREVDQQEIDAMVEYQVRRKIYHEEYAKSVQAAAELAARYPEWRGLSLPELLEALPDTSDALFQEKLLTALNTTDPAANERHEHSQSPALLPRLA